MRLLTRLGDTLLEKVAPKVQADAACVNCGGACNYYIESKSDCSAGGTFQRCCYMYTPGACTVPYCTSWYKCGNYC